MLKQLSNELWIVFRKYIRKWLFGVLLKIYILGLFIGVNILFEKLDKYRKKWFFINLKSYYFNIIFILYLR